jgi:TatA/E family protein of Tat protein translocase
MQAVMMYLFILDSLGNTELLLILAAALIFFGPRRLPQLGRQLGKSLAEFRRASEDFKQTGNAKSISTTSKKALSPNQIFLALLPKRFVRRVKQPPAKLNSVLEAEPTAAPPAIAPV